MVKSMISDVMLIYILWDSVMAAQGRLKALIRQRKMAMKKLAKSPNAYTVKCHLLHLASTWNYSASERCAYINNMAAQGTPEKYHDKDRNHVGNMVRAFVTDAGEVWARVIPIGE